MPKSDVIPSGFEEMKIYAPLLMERIDSILRDEHFPVILGGDHSLSIPTVTAVNDHLIETKGGDVELGLIWIDAHPDLEPPGENCTNDLHAMSAAFLIDTWKSELQDLRRFNSRIKPENLVFIGIRDTVEEERQPIRDLGITTYTASEVDRLGIHKICEDTFSHMNENTNGFVLSFDVDGVDTVYAPGVDYPEPGGLTYREAMIIAEYAHSSEKLKLLELLEYNPDHDVDFKTSKVMMNMFHRVVCGTVV